MRDEDKLVRVAGLEPAQPDGREILSLLCLPISPHPRFKMAVCVSTAETACQGWGLYYRLCQFLRLLRISRVCFFK